MADVLKRQGNILDLVPKDRLACYLKAASGSLSMPLWLLDTSGGLVLYAGHPSGMGDGGLPEGILEVIGPAPSELSLEDGCRLMAAPINFNGGPLGYILARGDGAEGGNPALPALVMCASHLGNLAETGYEVESLSGEVVRVYEELSLIYALTSKIGSKVDLREICRIVAEEAGKVLNPTDIILQLADEEAGALDTVFASGAHREMAEGFSPRLEEGLTGAAYVGHRSVIVCDVSGDDRHAGWPYPVKSLIAVPLVSEDKVLGVITATDKLGGGEFDSREEKLVLAICSVAAIAIKNAQLYTEIKGLLEGFIHASVTAVESRDPTTAGHSARVAAMTVELAKKVDASGLPAFRNISFTREQLVEIHYAGLLHDFGKIGVRESVLLKAAKLQPHQLELVKGRFEYIKERKTREALEKKLEAALMGGNGYENAASAIDSALAEEISRHDRYLSLLDVANDPNLLLSNTPELRGLDEVAGSYYEDPSGQMRPCLTQSELENLHVLIGSLNEEERREIEQHVTHSYNFLEKIPWTRSFPQIADMVYAHHERLNGSGYPRGLTSESIPFASKMMAVADVFDALTAWDRPYKKTVSTQKALFILEMEASAGKLDPRLVQIFKDARVYQAALDMRPPARSSGG